MQYLLILTLLGNGGNDGQGGLSTILLPSKSACVLAGRTWINDLKDRNSSWGISTKDSFYTCVKVD